MTFQEKADFLENKCMSLWKKYRNCGECPITGLCKGDSFEDCLESELDEMLEILGQSGEENGKQEKKVHNTPLDDIMRHAEIGKELNDLYRRKNADYGDSFHKSYEEWGLTMAAIRICDKYNRFAQLVHKGGDSLVKDESIRDTLIDLANYAIMTVMELDEERNNKNGNEA